MNIIPAVNIKNGRCVNLIPGQYHDAEVISRSVTQVVSDWEAAGASMLHVIDVDGALVGHTCNEEVIRRICQTVSIPVEVGGGIRSIKAIESVLDMGVSRVVIGTKAVGNSGFIRDALSIFGADRIVIAIDAKNSIVAVEGWGKLSSYNALNLAIEMRDLGVRTIEYTDILRNEMRKGPNVEHTKEILKIAGLDVIVNGGLDSMKDLELVNEIQVYGAIVDRALYDKKIELEQAIRLFQE